MVIGRIDHVVFNCRDVEAMADWYARVLGFEREEFCGPIQRIALKFGDQKINLRPTGADNWLTGNVDSPGSIDICFVTESGIEAAVERLRKADVGIIRGPVTQKGALGEMKSVYFRDPEGNLLEIAAYAPSGLDNRLQPSNVSATIAASSTDDRSGTDGKPNRRRLTWRWLYKSPGATQLKGDFSILSLLAKSLLRSRAMVGVSKISKKFIATLLSGITLGSLAEYGLNFMTEPVAFVSGILFGYLLFW